MAATLDRRVWRRAVEPAAIDQELAALWSEIGRERAVARAMMSNLVVMRERPGRGPLDLTAPPEGIPIDDVARRHPARILLLYHTPNAPADTSPVAAAVSVTTFGFDAARYGVETIAVDSRCHEAALPSIVRRLTVGDRPTTIWWTDDLSHDAPRAPLATLARQVVFDSRQWRDPRAGVRAAAAILAADAPPVVADLNWRRLTPLRAALASVVRTHERVLDHGFRAHVQYRPGDRVLAELLCGWIAAQMRWPPDAWPIALDEWRHGDAVLRLTLADSSGGTVTAEQNSHRVIVRDRTLRTPIALPVAHEAIPDVVAAELASLTQDVCLGAAVRALASRLP